MTNWNGLRVLCAGDSLAASAEAAWDGQTIKESGWPVNWEQAAPDQESILDALGAANDDVGPVEVCRS